jgi:hypothetical protein
MFLFLGISFGEFNNHGRRRNEGICSSESFEKMVGNFRRKVKGLWRIMTVGNKKILRRCLEGKKEVEDVVLKRC